jgi:hypothetical protein
MASMYDPLRDFLRRVVGNTVTLTFKAINTLIQTRNPQKMLPKSAYSRVKWWGNNSKGHTQCISWNSAGWDVASGGFKRGTSVTFIRT